MRRDEHENSTAWWGTCDTEECSTNVVVFPHPEATSALPGQADWEGPGRCYVCDGEVLWGGSDAVKDVRLSDSPTPSEGDWAVFDYDDGHVYNVDPPTERNANREALAIDATHNLPYRRHLPYPVPVARALANAWAHGRSAARDAARAATSATQAHPTTKDGVAS